MRLVIDAKSGQWVKATTEWERIIAKATTQAMHDVGRDAVQLGRQAIAGAGFSSRFQQSLKVKFFPSGGKPVLNPVAWIHTTINFADVFEFGAQIPGRPYLWLPLPNVPPGKNGPHMTPREYVDSVGPLVTIRRPNGTPMLGARIGGESPIRRAFKKLSGRKRAAGSTRARVVPLFVAVRQVTIPKKFDVLAQTERAFEELPDLYTKHLEPYIDPNGP